MTNSYFSDGYCTTNQCVSLPNIKWQQILIYCDPTRRGWQYLAACITTVCWSHTWRYHLKKGLCQRLHTAWHPQVDSVDSVRFGMLKPFMVYHYRFKIIISLSWYLYIIMVKPSWYIIKARQQSSCLLLPFKHSPKRIEQLQTGKFMGKHHLYHPGTTWSILFGSNIIVSYWREFTCVGYIILHSTFGDWLVFVGPKSDDLPETISFCKSNHIT